MNAKNYEVLTQTYFSADILIIINGFDVIPSLWMLGMFSRILGKRATL